MPYLPGLLKHYTAFPIPKHAVEKFGANWTRPREPRRQRPYKLVEWRTGDFLRSVKNEKFAGIDEVCFDEVVYLPVDDHSVMVRRAQAGEIDMNNSFPSGQLEKTSQDLPGWPRIAR